MSRLTPKSSATILPITAVQNTMEGWGEFLDDMRRYYGVDMDCLSEPFRWNQGGHDV